MAENNSDNLETYFKAEYRSGRSNDLIIKKRKVNMMQKGSRKRSFFIQKIINTVNKLSKLKAWIFPEDR